MPSDICKKIDKRIEEENQAMYSWMKNDDEEYDEQFELMFEDSADDDERDEWEEEYLEDYIEYVQDWDIYTTS